MGLPLRATTPVSAYLARQPIVDARRLVYGYEILYRPNDVPTAGPVGVREACTLLVEALTTFGLEQLVGERLAFLNASESFLLSNSIDILPPSRFVVEILESVSPSEEVIALLGDMRRRGFQLALDDYAFQPALAPFLPHINMIKVDIEAIDLRAEENRIRKLRKDGHILIAEKVETVEDFRRCRAYGFSYFQGFFLFRPETLSGKSASSAHSVLLALLVKLQDPNTSLKQIAALIEADAGLSFRLLAYMRSAAVAAHERVHSIREAVFRLGLRCTASLATALVLSSIPQKSPELISMALIRAMLCEATAKELRFASPDRYFTLGLFSVLDVLFDMPMEELIAQVPISEELVNALSRQDLDSDLAKVLQFVEAWEAGDWESAERLRPCDMALDQMYLDVVRRADALLHAGVERT